MPLGAALVGGGAALLGGYLQGEATKDAAKTAAKAAEFRPFGVTGGLGGVTFKGREAQLALDPRMEMLQAQMLGEALSGPSPLFAQTGQLFGAGGMGTFGGGLLQQALGQGLFQAGALTDPNQIAQQQFAREMALLQPEQQRQMSSLEQRLFAQGRLGSSGGAQQFGDLMKAQETARAGAAQRALAGGLDYTGQLFGRGLEAMRLGTAQVGAGAGLFGQQLGLEDQMFQRMMARIQGAQMVEEPAYRAAGLGAQLGGGAAAAGAAQAPYLFGAGQVNPAASALMGFGQTIAASPGLFSGGSQSGVAGVTPGSQQDLMLAEQWR